MSVKATLAAIALLVSPHLQAGNLFNATNEPLLINQCPITITNNPFDLALMNTGYFVVSKGKSNSEQLFTRFGQMLLDENGYVRNNSGDYFLAVTKKSDASHLSKIRISRKPLAPKASTQISIGLNLPANALNASDYDASSTIYDSLSNTHVASIKAVKTAVGHWKVIVSVDGIERDRGALVFSDKGEFTRQEGLNHVQWPADYGMHELKIDLKSSTQFSSSYSVQFLRSDGYPMGVFASAGVSQDGEIYLLYTNGQYKKLKNRIAVALFTNPGYLEHVAGNLYRPSEQSGRAMIHWVNSEHAVLGGALELEACLAG